MRTATISDPLPIDDLNAWLVDFLQPTVWVEFAALGACVLVAWFVATLLRQAIEEQRNPSSIFFGRRVIDGVLFPVLLLIFGHIARAVLLKYAPLAVFKVAIPVLVSLVVIRLGVKVLQVALSTAPWVKALERSISWIAWLGMVLWVIDPARFIHEAA